MSALIIILVFLITYAGMAAGRLPWLGLDRTGIALLGVIALLATETVTVDDLGATIDTSTMVLLFALMIISAQFVYAGFYELCAEWITSQGGGPTCQVGRVGACYHGFSGCASRIDTRAAE
jgi:Na+/H+ antiporter NhaD/arsenite permease-like protein